MPTVLIVDDEPSILTSLSFALEDEFTVYTAMSREAGQGVLESEDVDVVLLDLKIGGSSGLDMLRWIRTHNENVVVIVITAFGSISSAVECMQAGAYYYVAKPLDITQLKLVMGKALEYASLKGKLAYLDSELSRTYLNRGLVGPSKRMRQVFDIVEKVKDLPSNVLITGESGTGKELVARAIHFGGSRRNGRFEVIDCAAIPATLLESELFGFEKGAFTGATRPHKGRFELASGGTIFLDEIGDLDLSLQAKILRVIQSREFVPLGSSATRKVDIRVIAATNRDLKAEVSRGGFREDLFYRLNVIHIELPPLRERKEDIPALVRHFIDKHGAAMGKGNVRITPDALTALEAYDFPGNVRELENMIERALALSTGDEVGLADLPADVGEFLCPHSSMAGTPVLTIYPGMSLEEVERLTILNTLNLHHGSRKTTAAALGMSERTLRHKLRQYRRKEVAAQEDGQ